MTYADALTRRRVIDTILLDGKPVAKGYDIANFKIRTFSISDGQKLRSAEIWVDTGGVYQLAKIKLIVNDRILYEE